MDAFAVLRVPGEDLPWALGPSLLVVGAACALAIGSVWEDATPSALPTAAEIEPPEAPPESSVVVVPPTPGPAPPEPRPEPEPEPGPQVDDVVVIDAVEPIDCAPTFGMTFATGSAEPESYRYSRLMALVAWLNAHPEARAAIEGHASSEGSEVVNLQLSHRRARHVATLLRQRGIEKHRLVVQAFGEYRPDLQGEGPDADRRVTVRVLDHLQCEQQESP